MRGKIWFIGDTHFNHRMIIPYCNRPFATVSEMNKTLIDNWNKVVRKEDKVIMNGDFALSGKDKIIEIGQQLNGRKTLILGNHDGASLKTYYDAGFEMVSKYPIVVEEFFIVSHMPQYVQENGVYVNIFAHVHDSPAFKDVDARSFCTSAERINYTPILFEDIKAQIQAVCDKEREEYKGRFLRWKTEHAENKQLTAKLNALEVDAEPVGRGEWVLVGKNEHDYETLLEEKCSLCGRYVYRYDTQPQDNYCLNCGAKMEVEP